MGALAAVAMIAIVLIPQQPETPSPRGVPFAGAVGVGSGLMGIPPAPSRAASVEIQLELARSAGSAEPISSPALQAVSVAEISATPGELVDRELGNRYRVRFRLASGARSSALILDGFQVLQLVAGGEVPVFSVDLLPLQDSPMVLDLTSLDGTETQSYLRLTHSFTDTKAP